MKLIALSVSLLILAACTGDDGTQGQPTPTITVEPVPTAVAAPGLTALPTPTLAPIATASPTNPPGANQDSNCNYSRGRNGHAGPRSAGNRDS